MPNLTYVALQTAYYQAVSRLQ